MRTYLDIALTRIIATMLLLPQFGHHGTLIIFGATASSVTVAADTGLSPPQDDDSPAVGGKSEKIVQIGNVACTFSNVADIMYPDPANPVTIHFANEARKWALSNKPNGVRETHRNLRDHFIQLLAPLRSPELTIEDVFDMACGGLENGRPLLVISQFKQQRYPDLDDLGRAFSTIRPIEPDPQESYLTPGQTVAFPIAEIVLEIRDNKTDHLKEFKNRPIMKKIIEVQHNPGKLTSLSVDDLLAYSALLLEATESPEARKISARAAKVAPPNRFAVIDAKGFRWVDPVKVP